MKMGYRGFVALLGVSQALFGCGSDGAGAPEGSGGKPPCACGLRLPDTKATQVAWNETTPLGVTPAEAFAAVAGSCTAPLKWEHIAEGSLSQVEPPTGSTDVTVDVSFYEGTARYVDCADGSLQCTRSITASAHVTVTSALPSGHSAGRSVGHCSRACANLGNSSPAAGAGASRFRGRAGGDFKQAVFLDKELWRHFGSEERVLEALRMPVSLAERSSRSVA